MTLGDAEGMLPSRADMPNPPIARRSKTTMPHFYASVPEELAALSHREAIERYTDGRSSLRAIVAGLSTAQLNSTPVPDTWSVQQIVCHLVDTDQVASYRMKRIVAEFRPQFDLYNENAFAERLGYELLDPSPLCELFRVNRLVTADLLRKLPDDAFERVGIHQEIGELSLGKLIRLYVHHLDHHLRFARDKRKMITTGRGVGSKKT